MYSQVRQRTHTDGVQDRSLAARYLCASWPVNGTKCLEAKLSEKCHRLGIEAAEPGRSASGGIEDLSGHGLGIRNGSNDQPALFLSPHSETIGRGHMLDLHAKVPLVVRNLLHSHDTVGLQPSSHLNPR